MGAGGGSHGDSKETENQMNGVLESAKGTLADPRGSWKIQLGKAVQVQELGTSLFKVACFG